MLSKHQHFHKSSGSHAKPEYGFGLNIPFRFISELYSHINKATIAYTSPFFFFLHVFGILSYGDLCP